MSRPRKVALTLASWTSGGLFHGHSAGPAWGCLKLRPASADQPAGGRAGRPHKGLGFDIYRSAPAFALYVVLMLNIVLSVLVLYLQSLSHLSDSVTLHSIELGCTIVFSCEVLVRITAAYHPAALLFDLMVWVDIASVVPFYIELGIATHGI